jgi:hypothetical protein
MFSVAFGFALASSAAAQSIIGMSSIPTSGATAFNMPIATGAGSYYGQATASASASSAPPSQYTPPPSYSSDSMMPYSSFTAGGYSSMACGYGYQKGSDNKCSSMSWVSIATNIPEYKLKENPSTRTPAAMKLSSSTTARTATRA